MRHIVMVEPSIFRSVDTFELGRYKWKWLAWLAAWNHVQNNPHARAWIKGAATDTGELQEEVERLRESYGKAIRRNARLVEGLEQQARYCQDIVNDFNLLKPPQIKQDIQSIADDLFRLCKKATGEGK